MTSPGFRGYGWVDGSTTAVASAGGPAPATAASASDLANSDDYEIPRLVQTEAAAPTQTSLALT
jgi:hypothetical protein